MLWSTFPLTHSSPLTGTSGDVNAVYLRAWIYVSENGLTGASELANILVIQNSALSSVAGIQLRNNTGTFQMRFFYYSDGGIVFTAGVNVAINTWYLIEFRYDTSIMFWIWGLNNVVQYNGNLKGATLTPNRLVAGIAAYTGTAQSTINIDSIAIDTEQHPPFIDSSDPIILEVPSTTILFASR